MHTALKLSKSLIRATILCAAMFSSTGVYAVDMLGVYQTAAEQDPIVGAAKAAYAAAQEQLPQARSALLPNVRGSISTSKNVREFPGAVNTNPASPTFGQSYQGQGRVSNNHEK